MAFNKMLTLMSIGCCFFLTVGAIFCGIAAFQTFAGIENLILRISTAFLSYCSQLLFTFNLLCELQIPIILSFCCDFFIMFTFDIFFVSFSQTYVHIIIFCSEILVHLVCIVIHFDIQIKFVFP